jgi:hypothetical protein
LREDRYRVDSKVARLAATVLPDGQVISIHGDYRRGAVLIKWKPDAEPMAAANETICS